MNTWHGVIKPRTFRSIKDFKKLFLRDEPQMITAETSNRIDLVVDLRPQLCCVAVVLCSGSAEVS